MKKLMILLTSIFVALLFSTAAMADVSVSWLSPPDGSTYDVGTIVNPTGVASGVGSVGGTGLDLALVIDTSGSMGWSIPDGQGGWTTGQTVAIAAAKALVNSLPEATTSVAIVGFASSATTYRALTPLLPLTNKDAIIAAINLLGASGGTDIGAGVDAGAAAIVAGHTVGRSKMQVLLSDGESWPAYTNQAATAYSAHSIITHSVGVPGHNVAQMTKVASDGKGVYTNVTNISTLIGIFDGTAGNLVGLDRVDIELPDGTWIYDIATDGLGNFTLPDWAIKLGVNEFTAHAYGTDQTYASATLTLNGRTDPVPEPSTMLLLGTGLAGLAWYRRRSKA